jgi:hypothetical protein
MQSTTTNLPGRIAGKVFDEIESGKPNPVFNAKIEVFNQDRAVPIRTVHSYANGVFEVDGLPPGEYWVHCSAFRQEPFCEEVEVNAGCTSPVNFDICLDFYVVTRVATEDCKAPVNCNNVTAGRPVLLTTAYESKDPIKPTTVNWQASAGRLESLSADGPAEMQLRTDGTRGKIRLTATLSEVGSASLSASSEIISNEPVAQLIRGDIGVTKKRTDVPPTDDIGFWGAIRNRAKALSFGGMGVKGGKAARGYQGFIDAVLCGDRNQLVGEACSPTGNIATISAQAKNLPMHGMAAFELLKTATEIFLLWNCGVAIRDKDAIGHTLTSEEEELSRIGLSVQDIMDRLKDYLGAGRLPYIERVVQTAFPGDLPSDSVFCTGVLTHRVDCPCLIELIWSYWHEEAMLVQSLNAISRRFQNVRGPGDRDPLAHLEIDPLRPLNNLLWGYVQDEQNLLSVKRRAYEYDHHYGLTLYGKALPTMRPADTRSKFIEGFHNLLHAASVFYKEDNDTNYIAEGFPLLNALKEVHLLLAQGAHNQFGDLPWTARVEMLIQQWLIARPEMRDFLQSRAMVPYTEAWMPQVDTMKTLQGWTDVTVTHFHDLATYGEQLLLSVRYGDWIDINDENHAKNWARYWRPEIQGYLHAYRAATGVDLSNPDTVDYTVPAIHLQKRLAGQRVR